MTIELRWYQDTNWKQPRLQSREVHLSEDELSYATSWEDIPVVSYSEAVVEDPFEDPFERAISADAKQPDDLDKFDDPAENPTQMQKEAAFEWLRANALHEITEYSMREHTFHAAVMMYEIGRLNEENEKLRCEIGWLTRENKTLCSKISNFRASVARTLEDYFGNE